MQTSRDCGFFRGFINTVCSSDNSMILPFEGLWFFLWVVREGAQTTETVLGIKEPGFSEVSSCIMGNVVTPLHHAMGSAARPLGFRHTVKHHQGRWEESKHMRFCEAIALPPHGVGTPLQGTLCLSSELLTLTFPLPLFTPEPAVHSPGSFLHFPISGLELGSSIQCLN